jgi:thiamine biosynthesis lipoprotein
MGSPFNIIFYSGDSTEASTTAQQCFQLVDSFVIIFSDYLDSSELNRLCAKAGKTKNPITVSPALFDIFLQSKIAYEKSDGTFDITLGPVTRLWRKARKEKVFPGDLAVKEKLALTGFKKISMDTATHGILLLQPGMQLDLGGIAQGYIAQRVIDLLKTRNIDNALVDVSGDIVAIGAPPGTNGWTLGINVPEKKDELLKKNLLISNKAVTTSGDVYQYMEHNGKRYSHIIDPQTGYGITSQINVTVIANDGTTADWLTKACSILTISKAKKLAHSLQAEVLIAEIKKGKPVFHTTRGFGRYWK